MTDARRFFALLTRGQRWLNALLRAVRALRALLWAGAAAVPAALVLQWRNQTVSAPLVWSSLTVLGGAAGLALSWRRRLGQAEAARWLDRRLGAGEILSAALLCLERGGGGPFDGAIIAQAEEFAGRRTEIRWPWRPLLRQAGITGVALAMGFLALCLPWPRFAPPGRAASLALRPTERGLLNDAKRPALSVLPAVMAQRLFPRDRADALRAEEALRNRDIEALNRLLAQAQSRMERQIARAASPEQRERLLQEQEERLQAIQSLQDPGRENGESGRDDGGQQSAAGQGDKGRGKAPGDSGLNGQEAGKQGKPGLSGGAPRPGGTPGQEEPWQEYYDQYLRQQGANAAGRGGNQAGIGQGTKRRDGSVPDPFTGPDRMVIAQSPDEPMLEFVLPGQGARVPLSTFLPSSRRAAEDALLGEYVPMEYLDSVRWYFLALAKAAAGSLTGSEEQP